MNQAPNQAQAQAQPNPNPMVAILIECDNVKSLGNSCERDLYNIHKMLIQELHLDPANIYVLTNNIAWFAKKNIILNVGSNHIKSLETIFQNIKTDSLYIHVSGHGYQGNDIKQIELDGRCEQIVLSSGTLCDYQFNDMLRKYISVNTMLRISVDTCHSGTFSNFCYSINNANTKTLASKKANPYFTNGYSISACGDSQLDSCDVGTVGGFGGGLTSHILENNNLIEFIKGDPSKVKNNLVPVLKLLNQEPVLLVDM